MARRHDRREIERLLRKRERRGLTYRELSEESGIPIPTLAWWSARLARTGEDGEEAEAEASACELVAVEVVEDEREEGRTAIEIVLGEKVKKVSVLVPATASEADLRRVLRAVTSC